MPKVAFAKQSISPNIYHASMDGYPRLFAELTKAKTAEEWTIEIDGFSGAVSAKNLNEAKETVRWFAKRINRTT